MINVKNYAEMDCPVCHEFHFSELDESDIEIYDFIQCPHCGWKCDLEQTRDKNLENGTNELSLNKYRAWFKNKLKEDPNYDYQEDNYDPEAHMCPVCGKHKFSDVGSFEICPQCGWEDDELMEHEPDSWAGCANDLCLNDFKKRYQKLIEQDLSYKYSKDGFKE